MEPWSIAPLVALAASGATLLFAGRTARGSAVLLRAQQPALVTVRTEVRDLHGDLARLAARLEGRAAGAEPGPTDR